MRYVRTARSITDQASDSSESLAFLLEQGMALRSVQVSCLGVFQSVGTGVYKRVIPMKLYVKMKCHIVSNCDGIMTVAFTMQGNLIDIYAGESVWMREKVKEMGFGICE